jgi:RNA polymerase sigma-70 factor (ECF subfamily)
VRSILQKCAPTPRLRRVAPTVDILMPSDNTLIQRTLEGDLEGFSELVARHRDVVFRVAARIVGQADAEDVSQEAFLRAFHRLDRYRGEAPFRAWLLQITQNVALNSLARHRRESLEPHPAPDESPVTESRRQPAVELERRERRERLELKLGLLRPDYRALLVLRDLEELSYEEIAQVLDVPLGTVKGRLHRARSELIDLLRRNTYDWELPA